MESLYTLFSICGLVFLLFSLNEVVKLKKEVNRLKGITNHLLKRSNSSSSDSRE